MQKPANPNHPEYPGHIDKPKPKDNRYEGSQIKDPVNIFNKIIEENFLNIKRGP